MSELWDVLNREGAFLRVAPRDTLVAGEYFRIVHAWIVNAKGEFLLSRRAAAKRVYPNLWETAGGKVLAGETYLEAACREVKEELGLSLDPACAERFFAERRDCDPNGPHFLEVWVFFCEVSPAQLRLRGEEVSAAAFFTKESLRALNESKQCIPFSYEESLFAWLNGDSTAG